MLTKEKLRERLDRRTPELFNEQAYRVVVAMADTILERLGSLLYSEVCASMKSRADSDDGESPNIAVLEALVIALCSFSYGQFGDAIDAEVIAARVRRVWEEMGQGIEVTEAQARFVESLRKGNVQ